MAKDSASKAKGLRFDFRAGQIGHSQIGWAAEIGPATRYKLRRDIASIIKIWFDFVTFVCEL